MRVELCNSNSNLGSFVLLDYSIQFAWKQAPHVISGSRHHHSQESKMGKANIRWWESGTGGWISSVGKRAKERKGVILQVSVDGIFACLGRIEAENRQLESREKKRRRKKADRSKNGEANKSKNNKVNTSISFVNTHQLVRSPAAKKVRRMQS